MGYKYKECKKGIYKDGHEISDIIRYCQEEFIPILDELKPYIVQWRLDSNRKPVIVLAENLPSGRKPIVLVTYDESTFDSNNARGYVWMKDCEPLIQKKTREKEIIVSHFVTRGGHLQTPELLPIDTLPTSSLPVEDNH
ncbi:hypothetical protein HOY80DRAFT_897422 [Tuber brumale]|nr:hypothetical protein HOY80DRAFT_897422 [Tuber brumale]